MLDIFFLSVNEQVGELSPPLLPPQTKRYVAPPLHFPFEAPLQISTKEKNTDLTKFLKVIIQRALAEPPTCSISQINVNIENIGKIRESAKKTYSIS